jgi:hypothetical protein
MTLIAFDRRAAHYVESKVTALDAWDDVDSLAAESRGHLERAHEAHVTEDWRGYLHSIAVINDRLVSIRRIARERKGDIEEAPVIPKDQLGFWTRSDQAVVEAGGQTAA